MYMAKPNKKCRYCDEVISRDGIGLNKKLFERAAKKGAFMCLPCMASFLDCGIEDLLDKIAAFKAEGCRLFS